MRAGAAPSPPEPSRAQGLGTRRRLLPGPGRAVRRTACPCWLSERSVPGAATRPAEELPAAADLCTPQSLHVPPAAAGPRAPVPPHSLEPKFGQPSQEGSQPSRKTQDAAPKPERCRDKSARSVGRAGAEAPGSAPADPGVSRLRLRPWPLSLAPGRVFHSTVWLEEVGDVLGAQGAGCGHKSPCGTSFPLLTRRCSWPLGLSAGLATGTSPSALLSQSQPGVPETAQGVKPGASLFTKERNGLSHSVPSPSIPAVARTPGGLGLTGSPPGVGPPGRALTPRKAPGGWNGRTATCLSPVPRHYGMIPGLGDFGGDSHGRGRHSPPPRSLPLAVPVTQWQRAGGRGRRRKVW
uniref:Uncharacterized protein LOC112816868 n=1 Tax=Callorhinus ursinus TaxID=34884 RepID=A0A3Q7NM67_CALUR|nr:uncharacterized protein LOC112816868 [Callorhinus ursinus]